MTAELDTLDIKMHGGPCPSERGGRRFLRARGRGVCRPRAGSATHMAPPRVDASTMAAMESHEERLMEAKGPAVYVKPFSLFAPRRTASAQYNAYSHVVGRPPPRPSSPAAMARQRMASSPVGPCRSATSPPGTPVSAQQQTQPQQASSVLASKLHVASRTTSSPASTTPFVPTPVTSTTPWSITSPPPTSPLCHSGAPSAPTLSLPSKDTLKSPSPLMTPSQLPVTTSSAPPSPPPPPVMTSSASALPPQTLEQRQTPRRALRRRRAVAFALSPDHGRMPPAAVVAANARRHRRVPGDGPDERKFLLASRRQRSPSAARLGAATVLGAPLQLPPTLRLLGARFAAAATAGLGFAPHADSSSDAGEMLAACLERRRRRRQRKQERGAQGDVRGVPSSSASPPPSTTFLSQPSTSLLSTSVTQSEGAESQYEDRNPIETTRAENSTKPTQETPADGSPQRHDGPEERDEAACVAVGSSTASLMGAELRATRAHISLPCELDPDAVRRAPASINVAASELCTMQQELLGILRAVRPAAACTNMLNSIVMDPSTKDQSSDPLEFGGLSILSPRVSPEAAPAEGSVVRTPSSVLQEALPLHPVTEASSHSVIGALPHAIASLTGTLSEESTMITVTDLPHDAENETEPLSVAKKLAALRPRDPVRGMMAAAMMMAATTSTATKTTTATTAATTNSTTTPASSRTKTTAMIMTTKTTATTNTGTMTVPVPVEPSVNETDAGSPAPGMGSRKRCWAALREGSAAGEPYGDKASRGTQPCWRQPIITTAAWGDAANARAHARVYGDRCDEYEAAPRRRNYATVGDYSWRGYQMESCYSSSCSSAEDMREALGAAGSILAGLKAFVASVSSTSCYSDDEGLFVGLNTDSTTSPPSSMTLVSQEMHVAKVVAVAAAAAAAKGKAEALAPERSRHPATVGHAAIAPPAPSQPPPPLKASRLRSRNLRSPWPLRGPSSPSYPRDGVGAGPPQTPRRSREESLDDNDQMTVAAAAVAAAAIAAAAAAELFSDTEGEMDQCVRLSDDPLVGRSDSSTGDTSELVKMGPMFSKAAASFVSAGEADLEKMGLTEDALEKMAQRILEDDTSHSDILWPSSQSMLWELSTLAMSSDDDSSSTEEGSPSTAIKVKSSRTIDTIVAGNAEPFTCPDDTVESEEGNKTWVAEVPKNASGSDIVADNVNTSNEDLKTDSKDDIREDRAQTPLSWVTLSSTVEGTSEEVINTNPLVEIPTGPSSESRHLCEFSTCSVSSNVPVDFEEADTDPVINSEQTLSDKEDSQISENDSDAPHSDGEKKIVSIQQAKECLSETQEECDLETEEDVYVKSKPRESDVSLTSDKIDSDKNSNSSSKELPNNKGELAETCFISSRDVSLEEKTYARVDSLSVDQRDRTLNFTHVLSECDSRTPQEKTSAAESSTQELTVKMRPMPMEVTLADVPPITEEQSLGQAPASKDSSKRPESHNTSSGDQTSSFPSYSFSRDTPLSDIKSRSSPLRICIRTVRSSSDSPLSSCEYFPPAFDSFYRKPSGPNIETGDLIEQESAYSISRQHSDTNTFSSSPLPLSSPRFRRVVKRSASASSSVRHSKAVSACWLSADTELVDCECTADVRDSDCSRTRLSIDSEYSSDMYEVLREYESLGEESAYASGFSDIPEEPEGRKIRVEEIWTEVEVVTKQEEETVLEWQRFSGDDQIRFLQRKRPASCLKEDSSSHDDENERSGASPTSQNLVWVPSSTPFAQRLELWKSGRRRMRSRDRSYLYEGFKTCSSPIDVASSVSSFNEPPFINCLERKSFLPQPCTIMSVTETDETDVPPRNHDWESSSQSPSNCELIFTPSGATVEPINSDAITECNLTDVTSYSPMDTVEESEETRGRDLAQSEFSRLAEALPSAAATRAALMVPTQISRPPLPRDRYRNKSSLPDDAEAPKGLEKPCAKGLSTTAAGAGAAEGLKGQSSSEWGCDCPDCGCGGDWGRVHRKTKAVNDTSSQESSIVPSEDVFANNPPQLAAAAASRAFVENTPLHGSADPTPPMRVMLKAHRPSTGPASCVSSAIALVATTGDPSAKAAAGVDASESPSSNPTPACSTTPSPRESEPTLPPLSTAITLANAQKEQRGVQLPPMRDSKYAPVCVLNGSVVLHPSDLGYGEPTSSFRPLRDALFPSCVFSSPSSPSIRSSGTSQQPTPGPSAHSLSPRPSNATGPSPFASYIRPVSGGATGGSTGNVTSTDNAGGSVTGIGVGNIGGVGRGRRCPVNGMAAPYGSGLLDDHHHRSPHGSSLFMPWQFGHSITTSRIPSTRNKCGRVRPAARFPRRPPHATSRHRSPAATRSHTPHPHVGGGGGRAGGVHHHRSLGVASPFSSRTMSPLNPSLHHHHPHPQHPTGRSPHRSSTRTGLHSPASMSPTRRQQGPHSGRPNSPSSSRWRTPSPSQPSQSTTLSPSQPSSMTSPQPPLLWRSTSPASTKPGSPGHRPPARQQPTLWGSKNATGDRRPSSPWSNWRPASPSSPNSGNWRPTSPPLGRRSPTLPSWRQQSSPNSGTTSNVWRPASPPSPPPTWRPASPPLSRRPVTPLAQRPLTPSTMMSRPSVAMEIRGSSPPRRSFSPTNLRTKPSRSWTRTGAPPCSSMQAPQPPAWAQSKCQARSPSPGAGRHARRPSSGHALHADAHGPHRPSSPINAASSIGQIRNSCCTNASGDPLHPRSERVLGPLKRAHLHRNVSSPHLSSVSGTDDNSVHMAGAASVISLASISSSTDLVGDRARCKSPARRLQSCWLPTERASAVVVPALDKGLGDKAMVAPSVSALIAPATAIVATATLVGKSYGGGKAKAKDAVAGGGGGGDKATPLTPTRRLCMPRLRKLRGSVAAARSSSDRRVRLRSGGEANTNSSLALQNSASALRRRRDAHRLSRLEKKFPERARDSGGGGEAGLAARADGGVGAPGSSGLIIGPGAQHAGAHSGGAAVGCSCGSSVDPGAGRLDCSRGIRSDSDGDVKRCGAVMARRRAASRLRRSLPRVPRFLTRSLRRAQRLRGSRWMVVSATDIVHLVKQQKSIGGVSHIIRWETQEYAAKDAQKRRQRGRTPTSTPTPTPASTPPSRRPRTPAQPSTTASSSPTPPFTHTPSTLRTPLTPRTPTTPSTPPAYMFTPTLFPSDYGRSATSRRLASDESTTQRLPATPEGSARRPWSMPTSLRASRNCPSNEQISSRSNKNLSHSEPLGSRAHKNIINSESMISRANKIFLSSEPTTPRLNKNALSSEPTHHKSHKNRLSNEMARRFSEAVHRSIAIIQRSIQHTIQRSLVEKCIMKKPTASASPNSSAKYANSKWLSWDYPGKGDLDIFEQKAEFNDWKRPTSTSACSCRRGSSTSAEYLGKVPRKTAVFHSAHPLKSCCSINKPLELLPKSSVSVEFPRIVQKILDCVSQRPASAQCGKVGNPLNKSRMGGNSRREEMIQEKRDVKKDGRPASAKAKPSDSSLREKSCKTDKDNIKILSHPRRESALRRRVRRRAENEVSMILQKTRTYKTPPQFSDDNASDESRSSIHERCERRRMLIAVKSSSLLSLLGDDTSTSSRLTRNASFDIVPLLPERILKESPSTTSDSQYLRTSSESSEGSILTHILLNDKRVTVPEFDAKPKRYSTSVIHAKNACPASSCHQSRERSHHVCRKLSHPPGVLGRSSKICVIINNLKNPVEYLQCQIRFTNTMCPSVTALDACSSNDGEVQAPSPNVNLNINYKKTKKA